MEIQKIKKIFEQFGYEIEIIYESYYQIYDFYFININEENKIVLSFDKNGNAYRWNSDLGKYEKLKKE